MFHSHSIFQHLFTPKQRKKSFLTRWLISSSGKAASKQHLKSLKVWKDKCEIMKTKLCEVVEINAVCGPFKCFLYVWWNGFGSWKLLSPCFFLRTKQIQIVAAIIRNNFDWRLCALIIFNYVRRIFCEMRKICFAFTAVVDVH